MGGNEVLNVLLFVDYVLLCCFGSEREGLCYKEVLQLYINATILEINVNKSTMYTIGINVNFVKEMER